MGDLQSPATLLTNHYLRAFNLERYSRCLSRSIFCNAANCLPPNTVTSTSTGHNNLPFSALRSSSSLTRGSEYHDLHTSGCLFVLPTSRTLHDANVSPIRIVRASRASAFRPARTRLVISITIPRLRSLTSVLFQASPLIINATGFRENLSSTEPLPRSAQRSSSPTTTANSAYTDGTFAIRFRLAKFSASSLSNICVSAKLSVGNSSPFARVPASTTTITQSNAVSISADALLWSLVVLYKTVDARMR